MPSTAPTTSPTVSPSTAPTAAPTDTPFEARSKIHHRYQTTDPADCLNSNKTDAVKDALLAFYTEANAIPYEARVGCGSITVAVAFLTEEDFRRAEALAASLPASIPDPDEPGAEFAQLEVVPMDISGLAGGVGVCAGRDTSSYSFGTDGCADSVTLCCLDPDCGACIDAATGERPGSCTANTNFHRYALGCGDECAAQIDPTDVAATTCVLAFREMQANYSDSAFAVFDAGDCQCDDSAVASMIGCYEGLVNGSGGLTESPAPAAPTRAPSALAHAFIVDVEAAIGYWKDELAAPCIGNRGADAGNDDDDGPAFGSDTVIGAIVGSLVGVILSVIVMAMLIRGQRQRNKRRPSARTLDTIIGSRPGAGGINDDPGAVDRPGSMAYEAKRLNPSFYGGGGGGGGQLDHVDAEYNEIIARLGVAGSGGYRDIGLDDASGPWNRTLKLRGFGPSSSSPDLDNAPPPPAADRFEDLDGLPLKGLSTRGKGNSNSLKAARAATAGLMAENSTLREADEDEWSADGQNRMLSDARLARRSIRDQEAIAGFEPITLRSTVSLDSPREEDAVIAGYRDNVQHDESAPSTLQRSTLRVKPVDLAAPGAVAAAEAIQAAFRGLLAAHSIAEGPPQRTMSRSLSYEDVLDRVDDEPASMGTKHVLPQPMDLRPPGGGGGSSGRSSRPVSTLEEINVGRVARRAAAGSSGGEGTLGVAGRSVPTNAPRPLSLPAVNAQRASQRIASAASVVNRRGSSKLQPLSMMHTHVKMEEGMDSTRAEVPRGGPKKQMSLRESGAPPPAYQKPPEIGSPAAARKQSAELGSSAADWSMPSTLQHTPMAELVDDDFADLAELLDKRDNAAGGGGGSGGGLSRKPSSSLRDSGAPPPAYKPPPVASPVLPRRESLKPPASSGYLPEAI